MRQRTPRRGVQVVPLQTRVGAPPPPACRFVAGRSTLEPNRLSPAGGGSSVALRRNARKKSSSGSTASKSAKSGSKSKGTSRSSGVVASLSDPKTLRRLLLAAKIVGPAVAAGALKASTGVRGALDDRRARQLGVPIDDVAAYKGPTGTAQARITGLLKAVDELRSRRGSDAKVARFVESTSARLAELSAATSATVSMPSSTQRSALRAVSADLDQLDAELMTFLVGPPTS